MSDDLESRVAALEAEVSRLYRLTRALLRGLETPATPAPGPYEEPKNDRGTE